MPQRNKEGNVKIVINEDGEEVIVVDVVVVVVAVVFVVTDPYEMDMDS